MVLAGFKPVAGRREAAWVGSIPTRLRHTDRELSRQGMTTLKQYPEWSLRIVVLWFAFAVTGVAQDRSSTTLGVSAKEVAWQEFIAPDKSFRIMFPVKPVKKNMPGFQKTAGFDVGSYKAAVGNLELVLMYLSLPYPIDEPQTSKRLLDGGRNLALASTNAQVLFETEMWLDDHPGRELLIKFPETLMRARIFLIERRMYTLGVTLPYTESNQAVIQDAIELTANRYFASFKRLPPKK